MCDCSKCKKLFDETDLKFVKGENNKQILLCYGCIENKTITENQPTKKENI